MESQDFQAAFADKAVVIWTSGNPTTIRFIGANSAATLEPTSSAQGEANFLIGPDPNRWHTNIPMFAGIVYRNLYPGIDLKYSGPNGRLKSEFLISAGVDSGQIRLRYSGAGRLTVDPDGTLVFRGPAMELREQAPEIFQESATGRKIVQGRYRILDSHTAGFSIEAYDPRLPLVIDPVVSYSTFLGGSGAGAVTGVAADSSGNQYVTGYTEALNFPVFGAIQSSNRGGVDAFVAKLNAAGTALVYATYIGGYSDDRAASIAVDSAGEALVVGSTASTNFPLASPLRSTLGGGRDGFALKLNSTGSALVYSTYLGGSGWDQATSVALDGSGNAYVAGDTQSPDFPVLSAPQAIFGGMIDAFVTKLSPAGAIVFSTFLGGTSSEHAGGIAVDSNGNAYVAGSTSSSNFPVVGPCQATNAGGQDAFVTKLRPSTILYSTYLGGSGADQANAIAIDSGGNAYVAGITTSPNLPTSVVALRTAYNYLQDAFVAKLNASGSALAYGTYLGGTASNGANAIAVDSSGNAWVAGWTTSLDLPVVNAIQSVLKGSQNAFLSELNPTGSALAFSTYIGGSSADLAAAIAIDPSSNIYLGGQTNSYNLTLVNPLQPVYGGVATGWVMKFTQRVASKAPPRDFVGNGRSDVLIYDPGSGTAYTGLSNSDGTFGYVYNLFTPAYNVLRTGDWTDSGKAGMVVYSSSTGLAYIGVSNGNGTFQFSGTFWSPGYSTVVAGDWNGDGRTDLILYNPLTGTMYTLLSQAGSGANFTYQYSLVSPNFSVAVGDFNGDGKADMLLYRSTDGLCFLGLSNGNGTFQYSPLFLSSGFDVQVGDFNGDGKSDILLYNVATGTSFLGVNTGAGFTFSPQTSMPGLIARTGDFNGDGISDIVLYNPATGTAELRLGNGNGTLSVSSFSSSPGATSVIPQDLNGDGKTDLILFNSNTGMALSGISSGSGFTFSSSFWGLNRTLAQ